MRYNNKKYYLKQVCIVVLLSVNYSCFTDDPQLIQLPDKTPPSGYIINPIDGSSISGNVSLEVIAIDNEQIDSVFFLIKSQNSSSYQNIDSTKKQEQDIWKGSWNTTNSQWIENENITQNSYKINPNPYKIIQNRRLGSEGRFVEC